MATIVNWQSRALEMLNSFPEEPEQGWEAWVKNPTPVEFDRGCIDLSKKIIWINPKQGTKDLDMFAVDPSPLLEKIPGMITAMFSKPMRGGSGWYRDHNQKLIEVIYDDTPESQEYHLQIKAPMNQHFDIFLSTLRNNS